MQIIIHGSTGRMGQNMIACARAAGHGIAAEVSPEVVENAMKVFAQTVAGSFPQRCTGLPASGLFIRLGSFPSLRFQPSTMKSANSRKRFLPV